MRTSIETRGDPTNAQRPHGSCRTPRHFASLEADGLSPTEIAEEAGCALSTVYKALDNPDRESSPEPRPRLSETLRTEIARLHHADPSRSAPELQSILRQTQPDAALPSTRTIARLLAALRSKAEASPSEPSSPATADDASSDPPPLLADFDRRRGEMTRPLDAEIALLRDLIRQTVAELADPTASPRARLKLRQHAVHLTAALAAALRENKQYQVRRTDRDPDAPPTALDRAIDKLLGFK